MPTTATVGDLFSCLHEKFGNWMEFSVVVCGTTREVREDHTTNCKTLKDVGIHDGTHVILFMRITGGSGYKVDSFSRCDDCLSENSCQFTRLEQCEPDAISNLTKKREDAYLVLCQKFNFSNEVIRAIEDNTESNGVRLADVLHRIYHKDPSITLEQVNKIVSQNTGCTVM